MPSRFSFNNRREHTQVLPYKPRELNLFQITNPQILPFNRYPRANPSYIRVFPAYARPRTARPSPPHCHDFCNCFASKNPLTTHPIPRASAPSAVTASVRSTTGRRSDLPRRLSLRKSKSSFAPLQRSAGNMAEAPAARPVPAAFLADCHRRAALRRHKS